MKKRISIGILLWLTALLVCAEEVSFTCKAPSTVISGQQFKLVYTLNKEGKDLRVPEISDFDVLFGPSTSHSSSFQIVNGKASSNTQVTYTYMLAGREPGRYTIAPATIMVSGDKYTSNSVEIQVLPPDKTPTNSSSGASNQGISVDDSSVQNVSNEQIFVRQHFSKTRVYEQEAILVTLKLYTRTDVVHVGSGKFPEFKDFFVQDVELEPNRPWLVEHVDGYNYNTIILKQSVIFPQHSGKINVDGGNIEVVIRMRSASRGQSIFDDFFQSYQDVKKNLKFSGAQITVKELPDNAPAGFSGAVGSYNLNSSISSQEVNANEAITLKLKISGTGNLKLVKTPEVKFPLDFDVYDPKVDVKVKPSAAGQSGHKSIEYVAIPRFGGDFEIPAIKFVYFDINKGAYKTLTSPEYKIKVDGSAETSQGVSVVSPVVNKEDVKQLATDIRFIHTDIEKGLTKKGSHFIFSSFMYMALFTPLFIFVIILLLLQKQARENANIALRNTKRANKVAKRRLKEAQKCLRAGEKSKFYEETMRALWGYIADKLTIPVSELTKDNVQEKLISHNCNEELIREFLSCLSDCEFARFSPMVDDSLSMENIYDRAADLIGKLDNTLR